MKIFRIKRLSLEGFRSFKNSDLVFPKSNVLLLIGNNGKGKSSILDSIALLLSDFIKHFSVDNKNTLTMQSTDINIEIQKMLIVGEFESENQTFSIQLSKQLDFLKDTKANEAQKEYVDIMKKFIQDSIFSNLPILVYYKSNRFFKPAREVKTDTSSAMVTLQTNAITYENAFSNLEITFDGFQMWFRFEEDIENDRIRRSKDFKLTNPKLEVIRAAIKTFFNALEENETLFSELRVERVGAVSKFMIKKGIEDFEVAQLSDGERMLLFLVCDIARRLTLANQIGSSGLEAELLQGSGIILIDEIDMHLHPKWQRNVLPALTKTFPNIQFIATTHSPQVLSRVQRESVRVLDEGKILMVSSNPIGRDANAILEEIQQVTKRPKEIEIFIESYFARINNNEFDAANVFKNQLSDYLDSEDPVFARANAMIERKKMLML